MAPASPPEALEARLRAVLRDDPQALKSCEERLARMGDLGRIFAVALAIQPDHFVPFPLPVGLRGFLVIAPHRIAVKVGSDTHNLLLLACHRTREPLGVALEQFEQTRRLHGAVDIGAFQWGG